MRGSPEVLVQPTAPRGWAVRPGARQRGLRLGSAALCALILNTSAYGQTATQQRQSDPIEPFNRLVFGFNKQVLDRFLITPLIKFHNRAIPRPARISIHHFFQNLYEPVTAENDLLQLRPVRAGGSAGRFVVNSTIGLVGLMDIAKDLGLPRHTEDFGQTLGRYGVGAGPYLVVPVLGSSNVRDLSGRVVDGFMDPFGFIRFQGDTYASIGKSAATLFVDRAHKVKEERRIQETSADYYATERERYRIRRDDEIHDRDTGDEPVESRRSTSSQTEAASSSTPPAPTTTQEAMAALQAELGGLDLPVQILEIRGGDLYVEVEPKSGIDILPCDQIWRGVTLGSLPGVASVTIANVGHQKRFVCSKLLPSLPEAPSAPDVRPAPAKEGIPMTMSFISHQ